MANDLQWKDPRGSDTSTALDRDSYLSYQSESTAPTEYTQYTPKPHLVRRDTWHGRTEGSYDSWQEYGDDARSSTETYMSTIPSEDEFSEDDDDQYDVEEFSEQAYRSQATPSTPRDFAELFPSRRRLSIRHDDATIDGNMNLRIDTQFQLRSGRVQPITLFHLRMHDLRTRDFSLRRYCRDSGREVCHSHRKFHRPLSDRRPVLQKSFTDAFSLRHKRPISAEFPGLKRSDSGYGSGFAEDDERTLNSEPFDSPSTGAPTNTVKLEFSNYTNLDVRQRGAGVQRRYTFEYWGHSYAWKRNVRRHGEFEDVSYHLFRDDKASSVAHIVPVPLTREQALEEKFKGGWVPQCSMWIVDDDICRAPDVAE